jgi:hypothetical protein
MKNFTRLWIFIYQRHLKKNNSFTLKDNTLTACKAQKKIQEPFISIVTASVTKLLESDYPESETPVLGPIQSFATSIAYD